MASGLTSSVSYSTVALADARSTLAFVTPGIPAIVFSTLRAQLAHVIPRTESFKVSLAISSPAMIFADHALARRIETAEALNARECAEQRPGSASLEAAGGIAVFLGAESPLN